MSFAHPVVIRFSQVDAAGILYFSRIFEICHEAYEAWMARDGLPLTPEITSSPWLFPLVHAEADYHAPCRLGDRIEVHVGVVRVGTSSVTLEFRLRGEDGAHRATVRHVHTTIDSATFTSRPLASEIRAWAERVAEEAS